MLKNQVILNLACPDILCMISAKGDQPLVLVVSLCR